MTKKKKLGKARIPKLTGMANFDIFSVIFSIYFYGKPWRLVIVVAIRKPVPHV